MNRSDTLAPFSKNSPDRPWPWSARLFVCVVLVLLVAACSDGADSDSATGSETAAQIALGEQVYQAQCASCHGANLEGEANWQQMTADGQFRAPPHDETGHTWHHGDAYLIESVRLGGARLPADVGLSNMPAYEGVLTDAEIVAVLAYIKSNWPPEIRAAQEALQ